MGFLNGFLKWDLYKNMALLFYLIESGNLSGNYNWESHFPKGVLSCKCPAPRPAIIKPKMSSRPLKACRRPQVIVMLYLNANEHV